MSLTASVKAFIISMDEESIAASTRAHIISLMSKKREGGGNQWPLAILKETCRFLTNGDKEVRNISIEQADRAQFNLY